MTDRSLGKHASARAYARDMESESVCDIESVHDIESESVCDIERERESESV